MPTIRFVKSTRKWQAIIRRKGFTPHVKTFIRREEASRWARQVEVDMDRGFALNPSHHHQVMVSDLIDRYALEVSQKKKSYAREMSRLRLLKKHFGRLYLNQINPSKVALFRDLRLSQGLSGATVVKDLNTLSHLIDTAYSEWGMHINKNPVKEVRRPKVASHRQRRLSQDEEAILIRLASKSRSFMLKPMIVFAIETGMRLGEMLNLQYSDVECSWVNIRDTKNGEARVVPLSTRARRILETLPKHLYSDQVFWRWQHTSSFESTWQRLIKRSGIHDLRFHDLRHEAISRLFERGLNVMEVASISGHKSMQMLKVYTHIRPEYLIKKLNRKS